MGVCALVGISGFFTFLFPPLYFYFPCFLSFFLSPSFLRFAVAGSNKSNFVKLRWLMGF